MLPRFVNSRRDAVQFILTVDSDSTPYPDALEHMLRAMSRRKVQAVTGWIHVRNYDESLVARSGRQYRKLLRDDACISDQC